MQESSDIIVAIANHRERYFGGAGNMLIPSTATVAAQVQQIPAQYLMSKEL